MSEVVKKRIKRGKVVEPKPEKPVHTRHQGSKEKARRLRQMQKEQ